MPELAPIVQYATKCARLTGLGQAACLAPMGVDTRIIAPALVRGARGLLGWSQADLAGRAGVSRPTVTHYEQGTRMPIRVVADAVRAALEEGGVEFIADGASSPPGGGMGMRLRARAEPDVEDVPDAAPAP